MLLLNQFFGDKIANAIGAIVICRFATHSVPMAKELEGEWKGEYELEVTVLTEEQQSDIVGHQHSM
jgi:hypothetical protein